MYGGFNELDGKEKCFSDVHYVDITAPSGIGGWEREREREREREI